MFGRTKPKKPILRYQTGKVRGFPAPMASDRQPRTQERTSSQQESVRWRSGPGPRDPSDALEPGATSPFCLLTQAPSRCSWTMHALSAGLTSTRRETPTRTEGQYHEKHWETGPAVQLPQGQRKEQETQHFTGVQSPVWGGMQTPTVSSSTHTSV